MKTSLVVMAAGLASRYGGNKQIAGMGPHGELLMEYSIHDALRAGFERVVFIIRPDMLDFVKRQCGDRIAKRAEVAYAFQDYSSLPAWYAVPEGRVKPFGTVHAVLCAGKFLDGPFAVINADDYYGADAFARMHEFLASLGDGDGAAMVGYRLKNTVSRHGDVTRGVCVIREGFLETVSEIKRIHLRPDGIIADISDGEPGRALEPDLPVSMNFWGFSRRMLERFDALFTDFLRASPADDLKSECLLPVAMDSLIRSEGLSVRVLETDAAWFGVTYRDDRPLVQQALAELHRRGVYGETL